MGTALTRTAALLLVCGCGPSVPGGGEDDGEGGAGDGSDSTSTTGSSTTSSTTSTQGEAVADTAMPLTTLLPDTGSDTSTDTMTLPELDGRWTCFETFEDPLYLTISTAGGAISGTGCGPALPQPEDPFASDNCGELIDLTNLGEVAFLFTLEYPGFPDFGPVDFEFIGGYDPAADVLNGILWTSTINMTVPEMCFRS